MSSSTTDGSGWRSQLFRGAPLAVFVAAGLLIAYQLLPVFELVAVATLIALILRTVTRGLKKLGAPPWAVPIILLAGLGAVGAFVGLAVVPNLAREAQKLISEAPEYLESLASTTRQLQGSVSFIPDLSQILERLESHLSQNLSSLQPLVTNIASLTTEVVVILFLAVYMAISPEPLISGTLRLVPTHSRKRVREFLQALAVRLQGWMVGMILVALFVGVGGAVGLWLLGIPLPILFGLIAGLLTIVPYLGLIVGALPPTLVALAISPVKALGVVVLFVILGQIEGHILQPMIMGRQIRVHPVMVLLSFVVMGELLGLVGALLAVPAAVVLVALIDEISPKEPSQEKRGQ